MKTVGYKIEMSCKLFANQREQGEGTVWMVYWYCCTCFWLGHFRLVLQLFDVFGSHPDNLSFAPVKIYPTIGHKHTTRNRGKSQSYL